MMFEREHSYMTVLPMEPKEVDDGVLHLTRLREAKDFRVNGLEEKNGGLKLKVTYRKEDYNVSLLPVDFAAPQLYRTEHFFSDREIKAIERAKKGLSVTVEFGADALTSYHLQLKIIHTLLPRTLAVFDDSAEKILSGRWVRLAAESAVVPERRYLYSIQAISDEGGAVWLHSHGLNRCGLSELEILDSHQETYRSHYSIAEAMADRMLELEEPLQEGEPLYLTQLTDELHLVTTYLRWDRAVPLYGETVLGGTADRGEGHDGNTAVIFAYPTQEDFEHGKVAKIGVYDKVLKGRPVYLTDEAETKQRKALAQERLYMIREAYADPENKILLELALPVTRADEEAQDDGKAWDGEETRSEERTTEELWFELIQILPEPEEDGAAFLARLDQQPKFAQGVARDDMGEYRWNQITHWLICTPHHRLTANDAYLWELEQEEKNYEQR
ncbi:MAG: DUF4026 domain-containing protein [Firmicutes bacterium]|nr:DUF4026 domain-containing protein [Bacillota bacterium]